MPMPLHEGGRRRANAHNQVERMFGKQCTEILNERSFRVLITGAGCNQRMFRYVQSPWRLLNQFGADFSRIVAPWLELSAEGMQQHYSLGFICQSDGTRKRGRQKGNDHGREDTNANQNGHAVRTALTQNVPPRPSKSHLIEAPSLGDQHRAPKTRALIGRN